MLLHVLALLGKNTDLHTEIVQVRLDLFNLLIGMP